MSHHQNQTLQLQAIKSTTDSDLSIVIPDSPSGSVGTGKSQDRLSSVAASPINARSGFGVSRASDSSATTMNTIHVPTVSSGKGHQQKGVSGDNGNGDGDCPSGDGDCCAPDRLMSVDSSVRSDGPSTRTSLNSNRVGSPPPKGGWFSIRLSLALSSALTLLAMIGCGIGFYFVSEATLIKAGLEIGVAEIGTAYETLHYQTEQMTHKVNQIETLIQMSNFTATQEGIMAFFNETLRESWMTSVVEEKWALGFGLMCFFPDGHQVQYPQVYFDQLRHGGRSFTVGSITPKANSSDPDEANVLDYYNFNIEKTTTSSSTTGISSTTASITYSDQPTYSNTNFNISNYEHLLTTEAWPRAQQWNAGSNIYHFLSYWTRVDYHKGGLKILPIGWLSVTGTLAETAWANKSGATMVLADNFGRIFTTNKVSLNDLLMSQLSSRPLPPAGSRVDSIDDLELGVNFPDTVVSGIFSQVQSKGYLTEEPAPKHPAGVTNDMISTEIDGKKYFVVHTQLLKKGELHLSLIWYQEVDSLVGSMRFTEILFASMLVCALLVISLGGSIFSYQAIVGPLETLRGSMESLSMLDMKSVAKYEMEHEGSAYALREVNSLFDSYRSLRNTVREAVPFLPQLEGVVTTAALEELNAVDGHGLEMEDLIMDESMLSSIGGSMDMEESQMSTAFRAQSSSQFPPPMNQVGSFSVNSKNPLAGLPSSVNSTPKSIASGATDKKAPDVQASFAGWSPLGQLPSPRLNSSPDPNRLSSSWRLIKDSQGGKAGVEVVQASRAVIAHFQFGPEVRPTRMDKGQWKELVYQLQFEVTKTALGTNGTVFHLSTDSVSVCWSKVVQAESKACLVAHKVVEKVRERLKAAFPTIDFRTARPLLTVGIASANAIVGSTGTLLKKSFTVESEAVPVSRLYAQVAARVHAEILVQEDIHGQAWMFGNMRLAEVVKVPPYWGPLGDRPRADLRTLYQSLSASEDDNEEWMYVLQHREKEEASRLDRKAFEAMVEGDLDKARDLYKQCILQCETMDPFFEKKRDDLKIPSDVLDLEDETMMSDLSETESNGRKSDIIMVSVSSGSLGLPAMTGGSSSFGRNGDRDDAIVEYFNDIKAGKRAYYRDACFQEALPLYFEQE